MAKVLVTGGAGYVGAHCCLALARAGHDVVVYDNLSNGHVEFVKWGPLERGDLRDKDRLRAVFAAHAPQAVIHCAGLIEVGESVRNPSAFYDVNVVGSLALLDVMVESSVNAFVFSSTCATYGAPLTVPISESHPQAPVSPYGRTKLIVEHASKDISAAHDLRYAHLRYFNAAGAAAEEGIGERHSPETHAIPLALFQLLGRSNTFRIFGADYDTRDGTCVRDYVHVQDLADAHVRAVERLIAGGDSLAVNLGTGRGTSVRELLAAIESVTSHRVDMILAPRRDGDAAQLVAAKASAHAELGWTPVHDLLSVLASAWQWHHQVEGVIFRATQNQSKA